MTVHTPTTDETLTGDAAMRVYVNIYPPINGSCGAVYKTRALADQWAGKMRIACVEVEYKPGEGTNGGR
jgi:hypothetical protein